MAFTTRHRPASEHDSRSSPSLVSSHDWTQRIRDGDEAAFEAMFRTHYDGLCRYVAGYLGSRDAAEDVVQGVFARIWDDRAHWVVGDLQHYLYAAARSPSSDEPPCAAARHPCSPSKQALALGPRPTPNSRPRTCGSVSSGPSPLCPPAPGPHLF